MERSLGRSTWVRLYNKQQLSYSLGQLGGGGATGAAAPAVDYTLEIHCDCYDVQGIWRMKYPLLP